MDFLDYNCHYDVVVVDNVLVVGHVDPVEEHHRACSVVVVVVAAAVPIPSSFLQVKSWEFPSHLTVRQLACSTVILQMLLPGHLLESPLDLVELVVD